MTPSVLPAFSKQQIVFMSFSFDMTSLYSELGFWLQEGERPCYLVNKGRALDLLNNSQGSNCFSCMTYASWQLTEGDRGISPLRVLPAPLRAVRFVTALLNASKPNYR